MCSRTTTVHALTSAPHVITGTAAHASYRATNATLTLSSFAAATPVDLRGASRWGVAGTPCRAAARCAASSQGTADRRRGALLAPRLFYLSSPLSALRAIVISLFLKTIFMDLFSIKPPLVQSLVPTRTRFSSVLCSAPPKSVRVPVLARRPVVIFHDTSFKGGDQDEGDHSYSPFRPMVKCELDKRTTQSSERICRPLLGWCMRPDTSHFSMPSPGPV